MSGEPSSDSGGLSVQLFTHRGNDFPSYHGDERDGKELRADGCISSELLLALPEQREYKDAQDWNKKMEITDINTDIPGMMRVRLQGRPRSKGKQEFPIGKWGKKRSFWGSMMDKGV